jgi:hypothetical protein
LSQDKIGLVECTESSWEHGYRTMRLINQGDNTESVLEKMSPYLDFSLLASGAPRDSEGAALHSRYLASVEIHDV